MIIVLKSGTPETVIEEIVREISSFGLQIDKSIGKHQVVIGLVGDTANLDPLRLQGISPFIEKIIPIQQPFTRASKEFRYGQSQEVIVSTPNGLVSFGQNSPLVNIAGPCSVESEEMIVATAYELKAAGVQFLRGGAYKPRTSPYTFQGYENKALEWLAIARQETGLGIVTEIMDTADLERVGAVADILQVGARNMQNFSLLKKVGDQSKPVLLKRGISATIQEWLMAAEYILAAGNPNVILCERGIRTVDRQYTRNTLDLSVVPVLRELTHLPIVIDPSHGTGKSSYVPAMAQAAIAVGTDGLMIEVHPNPSQALCDGAQSLTVEEYYCLMEKMKVLASLTNRSSSFRSDTIFSQVSQPQLVTKT